MATSGLNLPQHPSSLLQANTSSPPTGLRRDLLGSSFHQTMAEGLGEDHIVATSGEAVLPHYTGMLIGNPTIFLPTSTSRQHPQALLDTVVHC